MINWSNNHGANPPPNEADRARERGFLRLGDILAELAHDLDQKQNEKVTKVDTKEKPR